MPTAIATPCPSGPVVASTPGEQEILRMAGAGAAELAEVLDVVDRRPLVAGQVQQRVDQHRAVAGREDEAVAVGPVRVGADRTSDFGEQARSRRRPCPSACRDGRCSRPPPHPSRARGWRWRDGDRSAALAPLKGFCPSGSPGGDEVPLAAQPAASNQAHPRLPAIANLRSRMADG